VLATTSPRAGRVALVRQGAPWAMAAFAAAFTSAVAIATYLAFGAASAVNAVALVLVPFLTVSLALACWCILRLGIALTAVEVTADRPTTAVGDAVHLAWRLRAPVPFRTGAVRLLGVEEAVTRGDAVSEIHREVFYADTIGAVRCGRAVDGEVVTRIPAGAVPTFHGANNRILWLIEVTAELPLWPDVRVQLELPVAPAAVAS
jgi:hypothetical protein